MPSSKPSPVVFAAGPDVRSAGAVVARDGRSAAWMAAGWAAATGRPGRVAAEDPFELTLARLVASQSRVPVRCDPVRFESSGEPAFDQDFEFPPPLPPMPPAPIAEWARRSGRPVRLQRLAADLVASLPPGAILCVEGSRIESPAISAAATHPALQIVARLGFGARGAAVAWAVGAKAAWPQRTVVALTDAAGFAVGGLDLAAAGRAGTPVAVIVANDERDALGAPVAYEQVAALAGGHGEQVSDPARLMIHLRNAMTATIPSVINVVVETARARRPITYVSA